MNPNVARCPLCRGEGSDSTSTPTNPVKCRHCHGKGHVEELPKEERLTPPVPRQPDTSPERLAEIQAAQAMVSPHALHQTTFAIIQDLLAMIEELEHFQYKGKQSNGHSDRSPDYLDRP
jgi:DnaJ-class molecular chaperone